jgi:hypothetical protein
MTRIGLALAGGGHRATLFALGVLVYLADAAKSRDVSSISSVSGGSLTNGFVAQSVDYATVDGPTFSAVAARLAGQISKRGTLWASWQTRAYLGLLA